MASLVILARIRFSWMESWRWMLKPLPLQFYPLCFIWRRNLDYDLTARHSTNWQCQGSRQSEIEESGFSWQGSGQKSCAYGGLIRRDARGKSTSPPRAVTHTTVWLDAVGNLNWRGTIVKMLAFCLCPNSKDNDSGGLSTRIWVLILDLYLGKRPLVCHYMKGFELDDRNYWCALGLVWLLIRESSVSLLGLYSNGGPHIRENISDIGDW